MLHQHNIREAQRDIEIGLLTDGILPMQGERIEIPNPRSIGICRGHEPAQKHDGWLNEQKDYNVDYGESGDKGIVITDFSDRYGETQYLRMPAQAVLSLLVWLKQEEAELQRLAKEQG